jgi:uncharacterized protein
VTTTRHHAHHYLQLTVDIPRLRTELEAARDASHLPDHPDPAAVAALHDLVVRARLATT